MDQDSPRLARWLFMLIAACAYNTKSWAAGPKFVFHIPAGHAQQALNEFYEQSHVPVLYLMDALKGVETQPVYGEFDALEALARLLKGTGLTYEFVESHALIKPAPRDAPHMAKNLIARRRPACPDLRSEAKFPNIVITGSWWRPHDGAALHGSDAIAGASSCVEHGGSRWRNGQR